MPANSRRGDAREVPEPDKDAMGRIDLTLMEPALFDALVDSLNVADSAPALRRAALAPRRSRRA